MGLGLFYTARGCKVLGMGRAASAVDLPKLARRNKMSNTNPFFEQLGKLYGRRCQAPVTTFCWSFAPYNMISGFIDHEAEGFNFAAWRDNKTYTITGKLTTEGAQELVMWLTELCGTMPENINDLEGVFAWLEADNLNNLQSTY